MHKFLRAIGFSDITKKDLEMILDEVITRPEIMKITKDSEGNEFAELSGSFAANAGITVRGTYQEDDSFHMDYYYPYFFGTMLSTREQAEVEKHAEKESYAGICDEVRIGVTLIFYLQNVVDFLAVKGSKKYMNLEEGVILGALSTERQAFIQNIADEYDLQWIALDSEWVDKPQNLAHYMTTPDEFIWLVHHCQLMLTDSFHGSVFSILFGKPFRSFTREDNNLDMGSRLDTLFGSLGIGDWCRGSVQEDPDHIFYKDYASVPAVLERERQFALDYLKNALEIHE